MTTTTVAQLPDNLKQQVLRYLQTDNFRAAKDVVEAYKANPHQCKKAVNYQSQ